MCMVVIGGITRLTGSGLSMVQWNLLMGAIPPLSETDWQESFELYKQFPEYRLLNEGMTLEEYQFIFFWEYLHRMWGRLMGLAFILPFAAFLYLKIIPQKYLKDLVFILLLGGFQGFMGWFMVKSGLVDQPAVSQYRLTAHLVLALALMAYVYIVAFRVRCDQQLHPLRTGQGIRKWIALLLGAIGLQVVFGGFMAGLKASLFYPSYPHMGTSWVPDNLFHHEPVWRNLFENPATINFIHRHFPWVIVLLAVVCFLQVRRNIVVKAVLQKEMLVLSLVIVLQITLGIIALTQSIGKIPVTWGVLHQVMGIVLFMVALHTWLKAKRLLS